MEDISLHILDVAENSIMAGASLVQIRIRDLPAKDRFVLEIEDNGRGIPEDILPGILDPFYTTRTTRKIGLGLSFLAQSARETGGDVSIRSQQGTGTLVSATFHPSHIDMKPMGNLAETVTVLIAGNPDVDFFVTYDSGAEPFEFDTREIRSVLGEIPLNAPDVLASLRASLEASLHHTGKEVE